jgi:nitrile hydratase subunit alpha
VSGGHDHFHPVEELELRTRALESLLLEKGFLADGAVDAVVDLYEHEVGPMVGARVVAHAWVDDAYRERLLDDAPAALVELGVSGHGMRQLIVVENTDDVHNVVVCTLCSCYPWAVLGLPPQWYKSSAYRARMPIEPRSVLREFGLELDDSVEVRVWDSNSETRYMVLPQRPEGTAEWDEERLAGIVTRDSMVGVAAVTP